MFRIAFLSGLICIYAPYVANAASGKGDMQVGIIDPTALSIGEARRLCAQEPYLMKCDIVFEKKKLDKKESIFPSNYSNDNLFDQTEEFTYEILNANYE